MNLTEHLGKSLLRRGGIAVPQGVVARSPGEAEAAARAAGGRVAIKAQVPAGKRGKSGGIRFADRPEGARDEAAALLGTTLAGFAVDAVLVERAVTIAHEWYAAVMNDATTKSPLVLFSTAGGMDIEEVNASTPERVLRHTVDIRRGFPESDAARLIGDAVPVELRAPLAALLATLYRIYADDDLELVEINPLAVDDRGELHALDCKMALDDSARSRQTEILAEIDAASGPQGTPLERRGRDLGLLYIELDGNVGVLANGAGLTLTTVDAVAHYGGSAANFLEIGGEAYTKATPALELVLANPRVKSLLVNFCGAFAQTDVMAEGVVTAVEALRPSLPMFFSIHGTGEERAIELVRSRLGIEPYDRMDDAVEAAIAAAR